MVETGDVTDHSTYLAPNEGMINFWANSNTESCDAHEMKYTTWEASLHML